VGYHEIFEKETQIDTNERRFVIASGCENEEIPDFNHVSLDTSVSSVSTELSSFGFF
jgi:hypothetical protein